MQCCPLCRVASATFLFLQSCLQLRAGLLGLPHGFCCPLAWRLSGSGEWLDQSNRTVLADVAKSEEDRGKAVILFFTFWLLIFFFFTFNNKRNKTFLWYFHISSKSVLFRFYFHNFATFSKTDIFSWGKGTRLNDKRDCNVRKTEICPPPLLYLASRCHCWNICVRMSSQAGSSVIGFHRSTVITFETRL